MAKKKTDLPSEDVLTDQQEAFCIAYASHFDGARAAREAGYSEKSAIVIASQQLNNPKVRAKIGNLLRKFADAHEMLKNRIVNQLFSIAFSDITDFVDVEGGEILFTDWKNLPHEQRALIAEVSVKHGELGTTRKLKLVDKLKALELLGKHLGMFQKEEPLPPLDKRLKDLSDPEIIDLLKQETKKLEGTK